LEIGDGGGAVFAFWVGDWFWDGGGFITGEVRYVFIGSDGRGGLGFGGEEGGWGWEWVVSACLSFV
jgi:hypothetical protein